LFPTPTAHTFTLPTLCATAGFGWFGTTQSGFHTGRVRGYHPPPPCHTARNTFTPLRNAVAKNTRATTPAPYPTRGTPRTLAHLHGPVPFLPSLLCTHIHGPPHAHTLHTLPFLALPGLSLPTTHHTHTLPPTCHGMGLCPHLPASSHTYLLSVSLCTFLLKRDHQVDASCCFAPSCLLPALASALLTYYIPACEQQHVRMHLSGFHFCRRRKLALLYAAVQAHCAHTCTTHAPLHRAYGTTRRCAARLPRAALSDRKHPGRFGD